MKLIQAPELQFFGRPVTEESLALIGSVVSTCRGLSRSEVANTVCELLDWRRANGRLKKVECLQLLDQLEADGLIEPPAYRQRRPFGSPTRIKECGLLTSPTPVEARGVGEVAPVSLERVERPGQRDWWRELVSRYHYLGDRVPFGAHLRYLIWAGHPHRQVVGCLQFSSPAWRMKVRDHWVGWDDPTRARNLQRVVNNSRFLILPYVQVPHLASHVLSQAARRLPGDWMEAYGVKPLLLETLVDSRRFSGICYRAANWIELGQTTGRGRQDSQHRRHGASPKTVLVYPLVHRARRQLRGEAC